MKRWKPSTKTKQALSITFIVISVTFLIILFLFKDKLNSYASKALQEQTVAEVQISVPAFVDSAYNYAQNGLSQEVTFLEFGATNCSACKRMETVMSEIRAKYPNRVNVVFVNILLPENQRLMKYYGIAAIPTQVLLDKDGQEYFRHSGYLSVNELVKSLTLN